MDEFACDKDFDAAYNAAKDAGIDPHSIGYSEDRKYVNVLGDNGKGRYDVANDAFTLEEVE